LVTRDKGEGTREKGQGTRATRDKGEGRREKGEGTREKGKGRRDKGEAPAAAASERSETSRREWGWGPTSTEKREHDAD
jgi:hypothetical protein